jgi:hypothetical protein
VLPTGSNGRPNSEGREATCARLVALLAGVRGPVKPRTVIRAKRSAAAFIPAEVVGLLNVSEGS